MSDFMNNFVLSIIMFILGVRAGRALQYTVWVESRTTDRGSLVAYCTAAFVVSLRAPLPFSSLYRSDSHAFWYLYLIII